MVEKSINDLFKKAERSLFFRFTRDITIIYNLYWMKLYYLILLLIFLPQCSNKIFKNEENPILINVNGEPIYFSEFQQNYTKLKTTFDQNPKILEELKTRILNEMIVQKILNQQANKHNIRIPKEETDGLIRKLKENYPLGAFEDILRHQNSSEKDLMMRMEDQLKLEKLIDTLFSSEILISTEELRSFFEKNTFFSPLQIHAYQILVSSFDEAAKIRHEIVSNQLSFESAARKYSLSPDASNGGDMGFFSEKDKTPAFHKLFSLSVGTISQPIQTNYGYHIFKITEKRSPKKLTFEEVKNDLQKQLRRQKMSKIFKEWITKILRDSEIYYNETLFNTTI